MLYINNEIVLNLNIIREETNECLYQYNLNIKDIDFNTVLKKIYNLIQMFKQEDKRLAKQYGIDERCNYYISADTKLNCYYPFKIVKHKNNKYSLKIIK